MPSKKTWQEVSLGHGNKMRKVAASRDPMRRKRPNPVSSINNRPPGAQQPPMPQPPRPQPPMQQPPRPQPPRPQPPMQQPPMPQPPMQQPPRPQPPMPQPPMPQPPMQQPPMQQPPMQQPPMQQPPRPQWPLEREQPPQQQEADTAQGFIKVKTYTARKAWPIANTIIEIIDPINGAVLYRTFTNSSGITESIPVMVPAFDLSQQSTNPVPYAIYSVTARHSGFMPVVDRMVEVFADRVSLQEINMIPVQLAMEDNLRR